MRPRSWIKSNYPTSQFILAAVLLLLLPLLATMQYRLLRKVSEGERDRMRSTLYSSANRFSLDFDLEIGRIYTTFLTTPVIGDRTRPTDLLQSAFLRWRETTAYPRLIHNIYLASFAENGVLELEEINPETGQVTKCEWPAAMASFRRQLIQKDGAAGRQPGQTTVPGTLVTTQLYPIISLEDRQPALLFQLVDTPPGPPQSNEQRQGPHGIAIVTIDLGYVQQELLPTLVRHHFVEGDRQHYDMAIATRDENAEAIWRWEATVSPATTQHQTPWNFSKSDLSVPLFNLRSDQWRQLMRRSRPASGDSQMPPPSPGTFRLASIGARMIFTDEFQGIWDLHLRHYSGSLDVAVTSARRTNLLINFAILLMLTTSFVLMMVSLMRARRLAQEQMNFVAGISHELRTPLAVIDSAGYNLSRGFVRQPNATQEYGEMIRTECRRLGEMVEQVLDFATFRSGRQTFDHRPIHLTEIIDEALRASQPLVDEGGFRIEQQIPTVLPEIMADRQAMIRALRNLLSNAMKYGGEDRWIGLVVSVTYRGRHEFVNLSISDHGRGIAREDLSRIFEPFFRSSDARAAQIQGNGLGLSLVRNIVEAHNGTINVESQIGRGTSFTISLPAAVPIPAPETSSAPGITSENDPSGLLTSGNTRTQ